jgi:CheY-like chemotaxis protein/HPt (histidine-containing phosphotransfer) domain-containing protein
MSAAHAPDVAGRIRQVLAKISLFGWQRRYGRQLRQAVSAIQADAAHYPPEIVARAKVLEHILDELTEDLGGKNKFASIRNSVEGLARLLDDGHLVNDAVSNAAAANGINLKRTRRRVLGRLVPVTGTGQTAWSIKSLAQSDALHTVLHATRQLLQDSNLANQARQALQELLQAIQGAMNIAEQGGEPVSTLAISPLPSTGASIRSGQSVLVAEDDLGCQAVLKMQLAALGYDCAFAANGTTAFGMWRQGNFAAVLADLNMPGADGLTLTGAIRAVERNKGGSIPIIAITAINCPDELDACLAAGMTAVLPKPIELERLREVLAHWLTRPEPPPVKQIRATALPEAEKFGLDLPHLVSVIGSENLVHIRELLELFVRTARVDLQICRQQVERQDRGRIGKAIPKLKASAQTIGALQFAKLAESLEAAMLAGWFIDADALIAELHAILTGLENAGAELLLSGWQSDNTAGGQNAADFLIPEPVLIVDDDAFARRQLRLLLNTLGVSQIVSSSSAPSALIELRQARPSIELLISDLSMPGMAERDFIRQVADSGYDGYLLLIGDAGQQSSDTNAEFVKARDLRLLGTLSKPVTLSDLADCFKITDEATDPDAGVSPAGLSLPDISRALRNDEFEVHFQAKLTAETLTPVGMAAQWCWQYQGRQVAADILLGLAERYGLSSELFKLLFPKALSGGVRIAEAGFMLSLTVNLPARCLSDARLPEFILTSLRATGFKPENLLLEIGQLTILNEMPMAWDSLARLCWEGIRLSLDDSAPDSSAVRALCRIPFTEIKLDIGFTREAVNLRKPEFAADFIETAKACNLSVVAANLQTRQDLDLARDFGCDLLSGNLLTPAMPEQKAIEWLQARL